MYNDNVLDNPFPGLRPFEEEEDILFFGREKQIDELLRKLRTSRFLAIIGSSGSGKSSLVKCGLLPSLHSGLMSGAGSKWRVALFRPGNDPFGQLNEALSKNGVLRDNQTKEELDTNTAINETILRRSNLGLIEAYKQSGIDRVNNLLVLVDQFEEIFRFSKYEKDEREGKRDSIAFINLLLKAAEQKEFPIYVVFTMRSDFLGDCTEFRGLPEAINEGQYLVPRMTRDERREAITGPIAVGGANITPALLNRLLNDVGDNPDQLPILQHALMRTWDSWKMKKHPGLPLDIDDYEHIGTIKEALSQHAEEAFSELATDRQKEICEKIFKELTDKGGLNSGIRRPRMVSELCSATEATEEEVIKVIETFRKPGRGFLMPPYPAPLTAGSIIDISHESLMRVWQRLISWLEEEEESAQVYLHLCEAVNLYETGKGGLWRDPELQIALKWKAEQNTNAAWASRYNPYYDKVMFFLDYSRQQRDLEIKQKEETQRQRLLITRRVSIVVSCIALLAILLAIWAFSLKSEANKARIFAENKQKEALTQKKRADANSIDAINQRNLAEIAKDSAIKSGAYALEQQKLALSAKDIAEQQKQIAIRKSNEAWQAKLHADSEAVRANNNQVIAEENAKLASDNALRFEKEKDTANMLQDLANSKNLAYLSTVLLNEGKTEQSRKNALKAYQLNKTNNGPLQNNEIYNALHLNWIKSVNHIATFHDAPVRAITGTPQGTTLFSGDENGLLITSHYDHGSLKAQSTMALKAVIRSLYVSPDGQYLLVVLHNEARLFRINSDRTLKEYTRVLLHGKGYKGAFIDNNSFIVLSSEGLTKFEVKNAPQLGDFIKADNCSAIAVAKNGTIFVSMANFIAECSSWQGLKTPPYKKVYHLRQPVTCIAVDNAGNYLAAGTNDGGVWIQPLHGDGEHKYATLHKSAVNDMKFNRDADGNLQLATASNDKTVKLQNVTSVMEGNTDDIIVTLSDHDKWVYTIFYSPDGKYLFSGSEDSKIMTWNTTMSGLYNTLNMDKK